MSPHREQRSTEQLRDLYNATLDALRRSYEQLEASVDDFDPDLDEQSFSAAWHSDDPLDRNRAGAVLSNFERTYMLLLDIMTLAVKLAKRWGALERDVDGSPTAILHKAGVVSRQAEESLEAQRRVRNSSQHVYVELSVSNVRQAVKRQLDTTPAVVRSIAAWIDSLDGGEGEEDRTTGS